MPRHPLQSTRIHDNSGAPLSQISTRRNGDTKHVPCRGRTFGAIVQNLVAIVTWRRRFVHPCLTLLIIRDTTTQAKRNDIVNLTSFGGRRRRVKKFQLCDAPAAAAFALNMATASTQECCHSVSIQRGQARKPQVAQHTQNVKTCGWKVHCCYTRGWL